jgi:hypothetical protein
MKEHPIPEELQDMIDRLGPPPVAWDDPREEHDHSE